MGSWTIIPILPGVKRSFFERIRYSFLTRKLDSPLVIAFLLLVGIGITLAVTKFGIIAGTLAVIMMAALPVIYFIIAYPRFGIIIFLIMAYFLMWLYKMGINFPLGTLMDGMEVLFIISLFVNQRSKKDWSIFKGPVTIMILIWIAYNVLEIINPAALSLQAWLYAIRTVAVIMLIYFIFQYYIDTKKFIKIILKLWIGIAFFGAVYGLKQEFIGFFPFEETYLHSDPNIEFLLFIGGVWRKFSIFSDPVSFAYNMVSATLLCIGLLTGPISIFKKTILALVASLCMFSMLYSGTRGAFVLVPAAMLLLSVLKYSKQLMIFMVIMGILFVGLVFAPIGNQTINRFQSAFRPSDDASFNLRKINQKRIQPYIQQHPMGGGLGSVGEWGGKFTPNSYLGAFQPDSGYVRVAVELGWVGLGIFCMLMFTILKTGINNYYKIKDPELKSYCLAVTLILFALNFGNYPQEALVQYPSNVYFYLSAALTVILLRIDKQQIEKSNAR